MKNQKIRQDFFDKAERIGVLKTTILATTKLSWPDYSKPKNMKINSIDDITVSWLKENKYDIYFFGLGFIQVKLTPRKRLHFYHPELPAFVEDPHDHRYNFISKVLKGRLINYIYKPMVISSQVINHDETCIFPSKEIANESCKKDSIVNEQSIFNCVEYIGSFTVESGSSYFIDERTFHTVKPDFSAGPCITLIERSNPFKEFAKVIRLSDEKLCPFSKSIPEDRLWELVEDCLEREIKCHKKM